MTLKVVVESSITEREDEWEGLADSTGAGPFVRPGWFKAWWAAFGRGRLRIITIREGDRLRALLPLEARGAALASPTNWHTPEFGALASDPAGGSALVRAVMELDSRSIAIAFVGPDDVLAQEWDEQAGATGAKTTRRVLQRSPYVDTGGAYEDFENGLAKKMRVELRRRWRRLEESGSVRLDVRDGSSELERLLNEGFAVEESAWKGREGTAINSAPETRLFYSEIARWAAQRGWLRLAFLRVDDKPIAFDLCLETAEAHYLLKTGYDPQVRKLAPGMLMRRAMIRRAFEKKLSSYEFLGGDSEWKRQWTEKVRPRHMLHAFSSSLPGSIERLLYTKGRPLAKRIQSTVRTWRTGTR